LGGTEEGLDFWGIEERESHLATVLACLDIASIGEGKSAAIEAAIEAADATDAAAIEAANATDAAANATDAAANAAYAYAYTTYAANATNAAYAAIPSTKSAMQYDLSLLLDHFNVNPESTDWLASEFTHRHLWQISSGISQPKDWSAIYKQWQIFIKKETKQTALLKRYEGWLHGEFEPIDVVEKRIAEWYKKRTGKSAKQTIASDKKDSQPTTPLDPPDVSPVIPLAKIGAAISQPDEPDPQDHLGRVALVNTLAEKLASPAEKLPMTLALLGDWGVGKSSFIEQLQARLDELARSRISIAKQDEICKYLFAKFNAWEYEKCDNLRAALAQEVVNGLLHNRNWRQKLCFIFHNARKQHPWILLGSIISVLFIIMSLFFITSIDPATLPKGAEPFLDIGGFGAGIIFLYVLWKKTSVIFVHPLASKLRTYLKLPSYGKHLGMIPVIRQQLETLCKYRLGQIKNGRLLVFVDDLDRCEPKAITDVMDAIRLVMDIPNVAVVIAIDDRIAFRAIAKHYQDVSSDSRSPELVARDYLSKIIQLPINLPRPKRAELKGFVRNKLFNIKETTKNNLAQKHGKNDKTSDKQKADSITETSPAQSNRDNTLDDDTAELLPEKETPRPTRNIENRADNNVAVREAMQDSAEEQDWFELLTETLAFNNPRQLIRLKSAYSFLKGVSSYTVKDQDIRIHHKAIMCCLMWCEYLYQLTLDERHQQEIIFLELLESDEIELTKDVTTEMAKIFRDVLTKRSEATITDSYFNLLNLALLTMMPTGHGSVFKSHAEAEAHRNKHITGSMKKVNNQ